VWKILDFGVCKLMHVETTLTAGRVVGAGPMAPEQARGGTSTTAPICTRCA
jgi:hypothetical protein